MRFASVLPHPHSPFSILLPLKNKKDQTSEYSNPYSVVWSCLHSSHKPVSFCESRITLFPTFCQSIYCEKYEFRSIIQGKAQGFIHFDGISTCILRKRNEKCRFKRTGILCARRVIFPGRRQPSIVTVNELNYCVRNGNRCTLVTIDTHFRRFTPSKLNNNYRQAKSLF